MHYDYSLDMWSFGCVFAGMMFRKEPFFQGHDNQDQLIKIVNVLGKDDFHTYVDKYDLDIDPHLMNTIKDLRNDRKKWQEFITQDNQSRVTPEGLDLLDQLFVRFHIFENIFDICSRFFFKIHEIINFLNENVILLLAEI